MSYEEELKQALANLLSAVITDTNYAQKQAEWDILKKRTEDMKFSEVTEELQKAVNEALQVRGLALSST
ncbi:MAG: hypothetical protein WCL18_02185 [bacterium]